MIYRNYKCMRLRLTIILILLINIQLRVEAQDIIVYEDVRRELVNYGSLEIISVYSYHLKQNSELYLIDIMRSRTFSEPPEFDIKIKKQLTIDFEADSLMLKRIIDFMDNNRFLDSLYVRINDRYINIKTTDNIFCDYETLVVIDFVHRYKGELMQTYTKIDDINQLDLLISGLEDILGVKKPKFLKDYKESIRKLRDIKYCPLN